MVELYSFPPEGGASTLVWSQPLQAASLAAGVCKVGTSWFIAVHPLAGDSAASVQERDATGGLLNQWVITPIVGDLEVVIGTDGTGILVAQDTGFSTYDIQTYSTAGVLGATVTTDSGAGPARFIGKGSFDFGGSRIVVGGAASLGPYVFNASGVEQVGEEWRSAAFYGVPSRVAAGMAWDSTRSCWVEFCTDGTVFRYTGAEKTAGFSVMLPYSAVITWRDGSGHETTMSATATLFQMEARKEITVTASAIPAGATMAALYLARVVTPTRTDYYLQGTPVVGDDQWVIDAPTFSGAHPPATNNFPAGAATAYSNDGSTIFDSTYSNAHSLPYRVDALEAGGGGGGGTGGIEIDCGTFGGAGADIDCGGFV